MGLHFQINVRFIYLLSFNNFLIFFTFQMSNKFLKLHKIYIKYLNNFFFVKHVSF